MSNIQATQRQTNATRYGRGQKPIVYHIALGRSFDGWAEGCGMQADELRTASEQAILTRHHEAEITHESHRARGKQPDIWELSLGNVNVVYSIEPHAVVIRGYCWEPDPATDDGGGFYHDLDWHPLP